MDSVLHRIRVNLYENFLTDNPNEYSAKVISERSLGVTDICKMGRLFSIIMFAAIFGVAMLTDSCQNPIPIQETVYSVTFDTDGGTPAVPPQQVEAGGVATAPANPSKTGFVFMFWSLSGATTAYNFQTPVNGDLILIARWQTEATVEYWQVTWNLNGGSFPANSNHATQVVKGGTLAEPNEPSKAGNTFDGWYREAALTNRVSFPYDVSGATANITLYAKWTEEATDEYWQVTWNLDGGSFPANSNHTTQVAKGGTLAEPNAPTKEGSTFDGWYREAALTNRITFPYNVSGVTANITLYAKWTESLSTLTGTVTITGVANVGSTLTANIDNLSGSGTVSYQWKRCDTKDAAGTDITLNGTGSAYIPVAADIGKFIKVNVSREGYSGSITSEATEAVTDSPYAEYFGTWRETYGDTWQWNQFTISADKIVYLEYNHGPGFSNEGLTWTELVIDKNDYADVYPAGYRIAGANGLLIGLLISNDKQSIMEAGRRITGGQEFWEVLKGPYIKRVNPPETEFWQVTWELNGGVWSFSPSPTQVPKDGAITDLYTARKTGYDFDGWYFDAALTNRVTFPIIASSLTGDITLYAKWTEAASSVATLRIRVDPGAGFYTSLSVQRRSEAGGAFGSYATIPTSAGTHNVTVPAGTYRISYTYWSCSSASCMSSGTSGSFTVSSGQTRDITIIGAAVGF